MSIARLFMPMHVFLLFTFIDTSYMYISENKLLLKDLYFISLSKGTRVAHFLFLITCYIITIIKISFMFKS